MSAGSHRAVEHRPYLTALGITQPALDQLEMYLGLVGTWNARTNLTAAGTAEERVRILVEDPYRAASLLPGGRLVDVGSGNGSPGLVLAILRSELSVTLLEPRARRWAFLREAARLVGREDISILRSRCEDFRGDADVVTMRAVGLDLGIVAKILAPGGHLFVFGGRPGGTKSLKVLPTQQLHETELHHFHRPVS